MHGNETGFVEVDREPSGQSEVIQDLLEADRRLDGSLAEDEGIVGVLEDRARGIRGKRVG
jgi:hypothetical protein